jgi:hypothetical protein
MEVLGTFIAGDKPKEFAQHDAKYQLLRGQKRKSMPHVEAELMPKDTLNAMNTARRLGLPFFQYLCHELQVLILWMGHITSVYHEPHPPDSRQVRYP